MNSTVPVMEKDLEIVEKTIYSILNQTERPVQLIISVNDGKDSTYDKIREMIKNYNGSVLYSYLNASTGLSLAAL